MNEKNAWMVRAETSPNDILRLDEFRSQGIIATGRYGLGDLTGKSRPVLKDLLKQPPYSISDSSILTIAEINLDIFVNRMSIGDLVLTPVKGQPEILLGQITSDYYFDSTRDNASDNYPHQRKVKWLNTCIRKDLSKKLCCALQSPRQTATLTKYLEEIAALCRGEQVSVSPSNSIPVSYPLRPDFAVTFEIPNNITKEEAQRLSAYFASLYFVS